MLLVLARVTWEACLRGQRASVGGVLVSVASASVCSVGGVGGTLLLLLLLLLKYYPEEKNIEC